MSGSQPSWVPTPPPGQDELPYDDGEPMETPTHRRQMNLLIESLEHHLEGRRDVFVGGNMFLYYSQLQTKQNDFRGPDVFVVLGVPERRRKSWVVWEEGGKMPDVVIELLSESTEDKDRGEKMDIYARVMGVPEYYLYDPLDGRLEGYLLGPTRRYEPLTADAEGALPCRQLGLRLAVRPGLFQREEGHWLRWLDGQGRILPSDEERARAEAQRAEAEAQRAEAEAQRAEAEAQRAEAEARRAEALAARLAAYEQKFGKL